MPKPLLFFATTTLFSGTFAAEKDAAAIEVANAHCQSAGTESAKLGGTWFAYLWLDGAHPLTRVPLELRGGAGTAFHQVLPDGGAGEIVLILRTNEEGRPGNVPIRTEHGSAVDASVWIGNETQSCNGWKGGVADASAPVSSPNDSFFSFVGADTCDHAHPLYCIQVAH